MLYAKPLSTKIPLQIRKSFTQRFRRVQSFIRPIRPQWLYSFIKQEMQENRITLPEATVNKIRELTSGHSAGSRLFVPPINPFRNFSSPLSETSPGKPLLIEDGYTYCDTLEVELSQGYTVESMPRPIHFLSPFGSFYSEIKAEAGNIRFFNG